MRLEIVHYCPTGEERLESTRTLTAQGDGTHREHTHRETAERETEHREPTTHRAREGEGSTTDARSISLLLMTWRCALGTASLAEMLLSRAAGSNSRTRPADLSAFAAL